MRLTPEQLRIIGEKARAAFGADARIYLFGSRVDDAARGGDVDLYIEVPRVVANRPAAASRLAAELQLALGDQRFDILVADPDTPRRRIHEVAVTEGVAL